MHHLLDIASLSDADLDHLLARGEAFYQKRIPDPQVGGWLTTLFYEPSTRTRCSFTIAARRLGMEVLNLDMATSAIQKGEDLLDTVRTLSAMGVTTVAVRHPENRAMQALSSLQSVRVINAGDGTRAHPTQALGDVLVMRGQWGHDLTNRNIVICGNIQYSRVARSHLALLPRLGAHVHFVPDNDDPLDITGPYTRHKTLQDILPDADAIMMLRVQKERMAVMPDLSRYLRDFGLKEEDAHRLKSGALIMHPGPFNRNVEIASALVDHPACVIQNQVTAGVAIRMAVLAGV
ncbi:MAG: aspartate carbamoyltransferase catalytic subunit [Alphaproteobacteria bacterium]